MTIGILGLGVSGKAVGEYLSMRKISWRGFDEKQANVFDLSGIERVIKSPGISAEHPWVQKCEQEGIPVIGEIDLAFEVLEHKPVKLLGITGSNGKTTTTLLTTHLLNRMGTKTVAAGNIGRPLISVVEEAWEVIVIELSSFQLEKCVARPVLDGAVILNVTPNHLDRHKTFANYLEAKMRLWELLKPGALCFDQKILETWYEKVESLLPLGYRLGHHERENLSAAYALSVQVAEFEDSEIQEVVTTFQKPPHRIEHVGTLGGVTYVNDSKATSVDAVKTGVRAVSGRIFLIAGGVDKGGDFREWIPLFRGKVCCVFALGEAGERIKHELSPEIEVVLVPSLEAAVDAARAASQEGDTVLLSPGCSSYDQFANYIERGERFRMLVKEKEM